jgi:HSP20 family protein
MFGTNGWDSFDDVFNFQREMDRVFTQFWTALPTRTAAVPSRSLNVTANDGGWVIEVPMPGIDPNDVSLEVAGHNLIVRAEGPSDGHAKGQDAHRAHYEQALTVPQFLDLDKLTAAHRHGMLRLTVPLKESVKPRRVQIETEVEEHKQLVGAR